MKEVSENQGRTVLFVSHNMVSIEKLCSRAILLDRGKILYEGNTSETINRYIKGERLHEISNADLIGHPGRKKGKRGGGNSRVIFENIKLQNNNRTESSIFNIGDTILIKLKLTDIAHNYNSPNITINIYDTSDRITICANTKAMINSTFQINKNCCLNFQLDNCRLAPGHYSVHLTYKSTGNEVITDAIRDAISFRMIANDPDSKISYNKDSLFVPEGKWNFNI